MMKVFTGNFYDEQKLFYYRIYFQVDKAAIQFDP